MSTFAGVQYGMVMNVILLEPDVAEELGKFYPDSELVDITDIDPQPGIGWLYDGEGFTAPPAPEPAPTPEPVDESEAEDAPKEEPTEEK